MSNTVRRPRRRPREDSCAWVTLGWLLRRTAAFALVESSMPPQMHLAWRRYFAESSAEHVARFVERRLARYPHLRLARDFRG